MHGVTAGPGILLACAQQQDQPRELRDRLLSHSLASSSDPQPASKPVSSSSTVQTDLPSIKLQSTELEHTSLGWDRQFRHADITTAVNVPQEQGSAPVETAMSPGAQERKMLQRSAKNIARWFLHARQPDANTCLTDTLRSHVSSTNQFIDLRAIG